MTIRRFFQSIGLFAFLSLRANAGIFIVTDTTDTTNFTSLRGAVIAANRTGGNNTIMLGDLLNFGGHPHPMVYQLTISGADEGAALTGDLNITGGHTTIMSFTSGVTIDATGLGDRVFNVSSNAQLTLENLTITGGNAAGWVWGTSSSGEPGGAIYNDGTLDLTSCILIGNSSGNGVDTVFGPLWNGGDGGAIYNTGKLAMHECIIANNICGTGSLNPVVGAGGNGGNGGGIYNSGVMTLDTCSISNNFSGQGESGSSDPLLDDPSGDGVITITFNPVGIAGEPGGNGGNGGGIYNLGQGNVCFSTVNYNGSGNGGDGSNGNGGGNAGSGGDGAGVFNSGILYLDTCTVSENFCGNGGNGGEGMYNGNAGNGENGGDGGGIYNFGELRSTSCTIAMNLAGMGGTGGDSYPFDLAIFPAPGTGGAGGCGGGVFNDANGTNAVLRNTMIALNVANAGGSGGTGFDLTNSIGVSGTNGTGFDVSGNFTSQKFNLISTGDGSTGFVNSIDADQVGNDASPIDPLLGPLQNNGGFAPTHALLWGSPAIDQGNCFKIHTDQRGQHRPHIYSSISKPSGGDGSDIGAFELDTRQ